MKPRGKTMFAGIDFPSFFDEDLFTTWRRGNPFNPYDPESLLTGAEEAAGMTYDNSRRNWPDEATYWKAVSGNLTQEEILQLAPRALVNPGRGRLARRLSADPRYLAIRGAVIAVDINPL
jgi:hypothetical protein